MSRPIATVRDYGELHAALRARADELKLTRESIDGCAGFQDGYTGKLLAPVPIRGIGRETLGPLLTVLGLKIELTVDEEALARYASRTKRRRNASGTMLARKRRNKQAFRGDGDWGRVMRARQILAQSPLQRIKAARHAARIRWQRVKDQREAARCAPTVSI